METLVRFEGLKAVSGVESGERTSATCKLAEPTLTAGQCCCLSAAEKLSVLKNVYDAEKRCSRAQLWSFMAEIVGFFA